MGLFIFRFWPVLIPLLLYVLWFFLVKRRSRKQDLAAPRFRDGPWYWIVLSSFAIGALCFVFLGLSIETHKGSYTPPHMKDGVIVPGHVDE